MQTDRDREIERVRERGREMQTIGSEEGRKAEKQTDRDREIERERERKRDADNRI